MSKIEFVLLIYATFVSGMISSILSDNRCYKCDIMSIWETLKVSLVGSMYGVGMYLLLID